MQGALRAIKRSRLRGEFRELQGYWSNRARCRRAVGAGARALTASLKAVFDTNIFVSAFAIPGGQAERALVTGDRAMLDLRKYQEIRILSLRQFLGEITAPDSRSAVD